MQCKTAIACIGVNHGTRIVDFRFNCMQYARQDVVYSSISNRLHAMTFVRLHVLVPRERMQHHLREQRGIFDAIPQRAILG